VNGSYFNALSLSTSPIALPLKVDGKLISAGYEASNFFRARLVLSPRGAEIKPYQLNSKRYADVTRALPEATTIVGHHRQDNDVFVRLRRQYIAVKDYDGDNVGDIMILYTTNYASNNDVNSTLRVFGIGGGDYTAMQFDGGDSTQLVCSAGPDGSAAEPYTNRTRPVPVAFAVYEAP
jgi:hypothetical protein